MHTHGDNSSADDDEQERKYESSCLPCLPTERIYPDTLHGELRIGNKMFWLLIKEIIDGPIVGGADCAGFDSSKAAVEARLDYVKTTLLEKCQISWPYGLKREGSTTDGLAWEWGGFTGLPLHKLIHPISRDIDPIDFSSLLFDGRGRWSKIQSFWREWRDCVQYWHDKAIRFTPEIAIKWQNAVRSCFQKATSTDEGTDDSQASEQGVGKKRPLAPLVSATGSKSRKRGKQLHVVEKGDPVVYPAHYFATPYVHMYCNHLAWYAQSSPIQSLRHVSCQNLELLNNLQGQSYWRRNSRWIADQLVSQQLERMEGYLPKTVIDRERLGAEIAEMERCLGEERSD